VDRTRDDLIRQAVEYCLEDLEDLNLGLERLQDSADSVLDWEDTKLELLRQE
jgi:predicted DNA-binding protein